MSSGESQANQNRWWDSEWWKRWVERFWFLRGVLAAMAMAQLVPAFTDLSRWEFLRAFHALLIAWRELMTPIGRWLGTLLQIPPIPPEIVSWLLFVSSVSLPLAIAAWQKARDQASALFADIHFKWSFVVGAFTLISSAVAYFILLSPYVVIYRNVSGSYCEPVWREVTNYSIWFWVCVLLAVFQFSAAVGMLRGYGRGLAAVLVFVTTVEVLYLVGSPGLADWVRAQSDRVIASDWRSTPEPGRSRDYNAPYENCEAIDGPRQSREWRLDHLDQLQPLPQPLPEFNDETIRGLRESAERSRQLREDLEALRRPSPPQAEFSEPNGVEIEAPEQTTEEAQSQGQSEDPTAP